MEIRKHYDVVVVGSGAGGGPLAHGLAKRGKKVLIIEAGPDFKPEHRGRFLPTVIMNGYYHNMAALSLSLQGTIIYHSKNVGGTTLVACGNMVRSCQEEFLSHGIDLEKPFLQAEKDYNVSPLPGKLIVKGTRKIVEAANDLGYKMVPMPKGISKREKCNLCGDCVLGCGTGFKLDASMYIAGAQKLGAELLTSTKVKRVLLDRRGQAIGVETTKGLGISSDQVVLAAGGLNTPVILQNSNAGKQRISAGNRLFIDPFVVTYGVVDNLSQVQGPSMGAVFADWHKSDGFILSPFMDHWSQFGMFCPTLWNLMNRFPLKRVVGIMAKITDEMKGRVYSNGLISKRLTDQDKRRLSAGSEISKQILLNLGARDVVTTSQARGAHPGGTAAVGTVLEDGTLQVKGTKGLYVCDASAFPVTPGLPPILTITALAKWLAIRL